MLDTLCKNRKLSFMGGGWVLLSWFAQPYDVIGLTRTAASGVPSPVPGLALIPLRVNPMIVSFDRSMPAAAAAS